jgi:hypothetical protein
VSPAVPTALVPGAPRWRHGDVALVALFYLLVTAAATWPLVSTPGSRLFAPIGPGDPYLNLWILGWDLGTISRDPLALLNGRIFDANIFFPAQGTLAYSDHLILPALVVWPLWAATGNLTLCYNTLLFVSWWGSALAMYVFARAVTGSRAGALLAGLAWGFWPFRPAHLLHLQLQGLYFLPLAFLFLHRVAAGRRRRDAIWLGVMAALQAMTAVYWGVVGAVGLALAALALVVSVGRWRSILVRRFLLAGLAGAVLVAPAVWPYWQAQRREGFSRNLYEASRHAAAPDSYLRVPPGNVLYGRTGLLPSGTAGEGGSGPERELFPGFVLGALALVGAWRGWRGDARPLVAAMVTAAAAGAVLSLGPEGARAVYAALHRFVIGFDAVRAPARFGVLVAFGLAVLAALAVRELRDPRGGSRVPHGRLVALGLLVLAGVEYLNVPLPSVAAPPVSTPAGRVLAQAAGPGAVLYLPLSRDLENTVAMVASLEHRRPIVNGYSGQRPAFFMGLVDVLNRLPSPEALWAARDLGVRFIVSPRPLEDARNGGDDRGDGPRARKARGGDGGPLVARARLADGVVYELVWTPEAEAAVPRPDPPPPPPPGEIPFVSMERAVYRVMWLSGAALGLPAGEATIEARRLDGEARTREPRAAYHLAVDLRTAPWVSRFFEAHDRLETWADAGLLPLRHEQHLREGRRVVDRETLFDHPNRTVRVGDGPPVPLPRGTRDALAAFFYARTLPLAPGFSADIPVVESGRRYTVRLASPGHESIEAQGRRVDALKLTPRFIASGDRQKGLAVTLYLSPDAHRVPLLLLLDAGFGSFRLELTEYARR